MKKREVAQHDGL